MRNLLIWLGKLALGGARKGLLPRGLCLTMVGLAACVHRARAEEIMPTCYAPMPEFYGPSVVQCSVSPNPTAGAKTVRFSAILRDTDGNTLIDRAELSRGEITDTLLLMKPSDGAFDSDSEEVFLDLDVSGWTAGAYTFYIWAYDAGGFAGQAGWLSLEVSR